MSSTASTPAPLADAPVAEGKIPRPPNSWILFRADMSASLAAENPDPQRSQAEISKIIALMWKRISPKVKAEYERRAELKKLEHSRLYPTYRYNPKSKAEKEREREEKKQLKIQARATKQTKQRLSGPSSVQPVPAGATLPFPFPVVPMELQAASHYGLAGPSPPLSAANSPSPGATWGTEYQAPQNSNTSVDGTNGFDTFIDPRLVPPVDVQSVAQPSISQQIMPTRPYYRTEGPSPSQQPSQIRYQTRSHETQHEANLRQPQHRRRRPEEPSYVTARKPHPRHKAEPYQLIQSDAPVIGYPTVQHGNGSSPGNSITTALPDANTTPSIVVDSLTFDLPPFAVQVMDNWSNQNSEFQPAYRQATTVGIENDCFQLLNDNFTNQQGLEDFLGPLEVELGNLLPWDSVLDSDSFDLSSIEVAAQPSLSNQMDTVYPTLLQLATELTALTSSQASMDMSVPAAQSYAEYVETPASTVYNVGNADFMVTEDFEKFVNFDATYDPLVPLPQPQSVEVQPSANAYKPPAGAALSSNRRVAATWNRSFAIIDHHDA